jgi:hypothetical protein
MPPDGLRNSLDILDDFIRWRKDLRLGRIAFLTDAGRSAVAAGIHDEDIMTRPGKISRQRTVRTVEVE